MTRTLRTLALLGLWFVSSAGDVSAQGLASRGATGEIDRIDVTGVTLFRQPEIESTLEIQVGERFERARVVKTAENLASMYRVKGYEQVQVKGELLRDRHETVLHFGVQEGKPTRISEFKIVSNAPGEGMALDSRVEIKPGDILDQERLAAARRIIQEGLASEEFVGARIEDLRIVDAGETELPVSAGTAELPTARWVKVEFRVDVGDKASFGFRGNQFFTRSELLAFITEQRLLGLSKDYVSAIQNRIEDEYRSRGFAHTRITPYVFERKSGQERHITYEIVEGPRVEIESVEFDGNMAYGAAELRREFFARAGPLVQRRVYVEKEVQASADLLVEWIQSQGYLTSKLVAVNRTFVGGGARVRLVVYLYEGDRTVVESIQISGNRAIPEADIVALLGARVGRPLNLFAFNEGLEAIKATYRAQGYLDARISNEDSERVVEYSQDNRAADIHIEIAEGTQYRVTRVEFQGLTRTAERVVERELAFAAGDVLREEKVLEAESRIRRLGIFSEASLRQVDDPQDPHGKIIRVVVQEGAPGVLAAGAGYRQDLGVRAFGQTGYTNLFGKNHEVNLSLNMNHRQFGGVFCSDERGACFLEGQAQLGYVWPWFLGDRTTFRPRLQAERTRYVTFDVISFSAAAIWERKLLQSPNLTGGLTYNLERTTQFNSQNRLDNRALTIGAIIPSLRLDLRDNALAPTRGFFAFTSLEVADPSFGAQNDPPVAYYRFQLRTDGFIPVTRDISWFVSFRTGYARNNVIPPAGLTPDQLNAYALPLVKQFALGGVTSLRGFQEQEINLQRLSILGTIAYTNYRTQVDLPFAGALRFGPFLDAGNLLEDAFHPFRNLHFGAGFGFHYQSPVGPVNFDMGFRLGEVPENVSRHRFYFSIGVL